MSSASPSTAPELLQGKRIIVVPGDIAGAQLRHLHDETQHSLGLKAWSPARVFTWDQWLRSLWSKSITEGSETRLLLNATQEHALWRDIISAQRSRLPQSLTSLDSLAELAATAWRLSETYGATERLRKFATSHDARIFAEWAEAFARTCRTNGFLSRSSLESAISAKVLAGEIPAGVPLVFAGHLTWAPAQTHLVQALEAYGHTVLRTSIVVTEHTAEDSLLEAESEETELEAIARWARTFIGSRSKAGLPCRVGVVIPDLDACHEQVRTTFRRVLSPELQSVSADDASSPFALPEFEPLISRPLISAAIDLARWAEAPLSREAVSALLLSPFITPEASRKAAARFDACTLRSARLLKPQVSLSWLQSELRRAGEGAISWPSRLGHLLEAADPLSTPRTFAQWTETIRSLVRSTGWPGPSANAQELLLVQAWDHALDTVATLDFNATRATYADTLLALERELTHARSSSQISNALVQVLVPSAAHGTTFDAVIFARTTDENWPKLPSPNPLIGWQLQAESGMPGTDPTSAMAELRNFTAQLRQSAGTTVFSYARTVPEGEQRLSPLVAELDLPKQTVAAPSLQAPGYVAPYVIDDTAPLPPLLSPVVHGGAAVLQHQAACGFRAFAEIRLRSQPLDNKDVGYDARERGNLLHSVLQRFWEEVQTQRKLKAMPSDERRNLLDRITEECLAKQSIDSGDRWDAAYLTIQKKRLVRLLHRWMQFEMQRSDFDVRFTELKTDLPVGPIQLQVRVDRIDQTGEGEILVDYKTGSSAAVANWEGERPDEPQLPLYALLEREERLSGLAFAKVRPGAKMSWQGYANNVGALPGKDTTRDIDQLRENWYATLTALAESFADGDIRVDPKSYPTTCSICSQRLLCRLDSAALLDVEDPLDSSEEDAGA